MSEKSPAPPGPGEGAERPGRGTGGAAAGLLRSTPMRLTLALVALFTAASLMTLGASYLVTRNSLDQALRADLRDEIAGFRGAPSAGAVAQLVAAEAEITDPRRRLLAYVAPSGRRYGNAYLAADSTGYRLVPVEALDPRTRLPYLALTARLHGGYLTVANSQRQISDLGRTYLTLIGLSLLPTAAIALAGGLGIARRTVRRLRAMETTLDRLTAGDLGARVPDLAGAEDDLAAISRRINRMAAARQAATEALRQVSADIAHDLRTPIQRLGVRLQRLAALDGLPREGAALAEAAAAETEGIAATFQALLQIAQIEGGSPRARFAPVDLGQLAATLGEVYAPTAEDEGRALTLDLPPAGAAMVNGERALLGQVIANLLENALRHTPPGTPLALRVAARPGGGARLEVEDAGPGVPEDERAAVLRRLYRLERSRSTPGNGLGLSLVASIAELHGAALRLEDAEPGLRVVLDFPPGVEAATAAQSIRMAPGGTASR